MKIQNFKITIAVPDENSPVKIADLVDTLRDRRDEFNAENCAVEWNKIQKKARGER